MPSKGIKCYAYIAVQGVEIEFEVPKNSITKRDPDKFTIDHLEVESSNLPRLKIKGNFSFKVRRDGRELTNQWIEVNSMTGGLGGGTMKNMDQTPAIFVDGLIIVYAFYDAGPGLAGLPKQHQCFVTVTHNYENWMRDIAPPDTEKADRKFNKMVLPSAHDIGMNSMQTATAMLQKAGTGVVKEVLGQSIGNILILFNKLADSTINRIAPDIVRALAVTQKDSVDTILKIGARYFEFRPAKCHRQMQKVSPLEDTIYFQHGAIPGLMYKQFLHEVVQFLDGHKDEIVVVQNRWDGVPGDCPRATDDELRDIQNDVLNGKDIQIGNLDDMLNKSIKDLRNERKRLIILKDVNQVSNYDDAASATLDGLPIVAKLEDMGRNPPRGHPITLLQCQATSTNIRDVIIASVVDSDVSTSPLLATKAICDARILPVLKGECGKQLTREESVVVILNDFFDGATADTAISLCRDRLGV
ncbi:PLC-like phosphodiesterase [Aaosphaeria arxii CBS 175.79]|uniref:PLC-like phosphodiesterase n=1 Tax=Aaosphaeria arxii CBS 175.79 TaxID=1450172 RepID=A0A6A5Y6Q0_9PLEO|nr:PLC-like phosphodiesterase [Aaosphaeria arxii CBS 175.79]KAF2020893.1 PLC-like phosphodiesterase [Aaosphaeria arxii CBS 175.79]